MCTCWWQPLAQINLLPWHSDNDSGMRENTTPISCSSLGCQKAKMELSCIFDDCTQSCWRKLFRELFLKHTHEDPYLDVAKKCCCKEVFLLEYSKRHSYFFVLFHIHAWLHSVTGIPPFSLTSYISHMHLLCVSLKENDAAFICYFLVDGFAGMSKK